MSTSNSTPSKFKLGIDLGTTNSLAAIVRNDHVMVLKNHEGKTLTHSCVSFSKDTDEVLVGTLASRKKASNFKNTVFDVKRLLAKSFADENVKKFKETHSFEIINVCNKPFIKLTHNNETLNLRPLEVSARVLTYIRECAEQTLRGRSDGGEVIINSAVITVPAYFKQAQKSETYEAAKIAGFTEVRLITEPMAAAFAYGFAEDRLDGYRMLVFDFGGGTFDVSVLEVKDGQFVTRCIDGDSDLGGRDLDEKLFDHCVEEIKRRWHKDCKSDRMKKQELMEMCEELKIALSTQKVESIFLGKLFPDLCQTLQVTREKFEELISPLLSKAISIVKSALTVSEFEPEDIDEVLMVGGVSRVPMITDLLVEEVGFDRRKLNRSVCEDEAVVNGAAVYAATLSDTLQTSIPMSMVEIIPLSIGRSITGDRFSVIFPRSSPIPCTLTRQYCTSINDQSSTLVKIYEGERKIASKNNKLGELRVEGLTPGMAGTVWTEYTFELDTNGILHVTATHQGITTEMEMQYEMRSSNERDVEQALRDAEENLEADTQEQLRSTARQLLQKAIRQKKYQCTDRSILAKCSRIEAWLDSDQSVTASVEEYRSMFRALNQD